jgi:transcriptional regulator with XRE-family HTH domain
MINETRARIVSSLGEARRDLGLSQRELARLAGVHVRTIERVESGQRVSDRTLVRICQVLVPLSAFQPPAPAEPEPRDDLAERLVRDLADSVGAAAVGTWAP